MTSRGNEQHQQPRGLGDGTTASTLLDQKEPDVSHQLAPPTPAAAVWKVELHGTPGSNTFSTRPGSEVQRMRGRAGSCYVPLLGCSHPAHGQQMDPHTQLQGADGCLREDPVCLWPGEVLVSWQLSPECCCCVSFHLSARQTLSDCPNPQCCQTRGPLEFAEQSPVALMRSAVCTHPF